MMKVLGFHEVENAPPIPGLYSWGYDIREVGQLIDVIISDSESKENVNMASEKLKLRICDSFRRYDYFIDARSDLQPRFTGWIGQETHLLAARLQQVIEDKDHLSTMLKTYTDINPYFLSPLYIGKASKSLRQRLSQHCDKIINYRALSKPALREKKPSFAREVVIRDLDPTKLNVSVIELPGVDEGALGSLEYILNRTSFPIFGRS